MGTFLKRYRMAMAALAVLGIVFFLNRELGMKAARSVGSSFREMLFVIPPVFLLLGFLDVWVPRETMVRWMGERSGLIGIVLAILLGSAAAGPLYAAFPVAAVFVKKGASFRNVVVFIGAWSTTKLPMLLFEYSAMGPRFTLTRLLVDIPGIILIGMALEKWIGAEEKKRIVQGLQAM